MSKVSNKI
jgi:hypothetical protein